MSLRPPAAGRRRPAGGYREQFVGAESPLVYFDGNSLGRPLKVTGERIARFVDEKWGGRLIRGWDEQWIDLPLTIGDRLGRGRAGRGSGADGDRRLHDGAALQADPGRGRRPQRRARATEIVVDHDNFPTDRYVAEGIAAERGLDAPLDRGRPAPGVTAEQLAEAVGPKTALVVLSHVAYRSGYLADAAAHHCGSPTTRAP